jgi:hypothetical protein
MDILITESQNETEQMQMQPGAQFTIHSTDSKMYIYNQLNHHFNWREDNEGSQD